MGETHFLLFIGTFEKCLDMGETQFLLFIGTFGGNGKIMTFVTHRQTDRQTAPIIYKSSSSSPSSSSKWISWSWSLTSSSKLLSWSWSLTSSSKLLLWSWSLTSSWSLLIQWSLFQVKNMQKKRSRQQSQLMMSALRIFSTRYYYH